MQKPFTQDMNNNYMNANVIILAIYYPNSFLGCLIWDESGKFSLQTTPWNGGLDFLREYDHLLHHPLQELHVAEWQVRGVPTKQDRPSEITDKTGSERKIPEQYVR